MPVYPPCGKCGAWMVTGHDGPVPPGAVRHAGGGLCGTCYQRDRRAKDRVQPLPFTPEPWTADALCVEVDTELFFPPVGGDTRPAKRICRMCPVRDPCLQAALARQEPFGVWGGTSERDRRKLRAGAAS